MIMKFIDKWNDNKSTLENYYRTHEQKEYDTYEKIIKLIFELIINDDEEDFNIKRLTVIDNGDYQGTQLFIIPRNVYQPDVTDYVYTHNYYGSCSGCDTLLSISNYSEDLPTKNQIKDYMLLSLNLIENMKYLKEEGEENVE